MKAVSCDLESAPTLVASTLPFLKSIRVGMPRMPFGRRRLVVVDVEFGDLELARVFRGDLVEDGRDHLAWAAPLGPVVDQYRLGDCSTSDSKVSSVT